MVRIALCDDERQYLNDIEVAVKSWADKRNISINIDSFDNGDALLKHLLTETVEIIFLDIMMPFLNGMDLAYEIRKMNSPVKIVFLTSSQEFAIESYDVKASGYILKPFHHEKLFRVLDECTESIADEPKNILVKTNTGYQKVVFNNIEFIEAQNKKVVFMLTNNDTIEAINTFTTFTDTLTLEHGFYKCHRSYIVYIPNIKHFNTTEITTKSGQTIPISRSHSKDFKDAYFTYMFNKECD